MFFDNSFGTFLNANVATMIRKLFVLFQWRLETTYAINTWFHKWSHDLFPNFLFVLVENSEIFVEIFLKKVKRHKCMHLKVMRKLNASLLSKWVICVLLSMTNDHITQKEYHCSEWSMSNYLTKIPVSLERKCETKSPHTQWMDKKVKCRKEWSKVSTRIYLKSYTC